MKPVYERQPGPQSIVDLASFFVKNRQIHNRGGGFIIEARQKGHSKREKPDPERTFSQIFADFRLALFFKGFGSRRFTQKTAGNRRFSQETAENRRFLQNRFLLFAVSLLARSYIKPSVGRRASCPWADVKQPMCWMIHLYLNSVQQMVSGELAGEGLQTGFSRHGLPPQRAPLDTVYRLRQHLNSVQSEWCPEGTVRVCLQTRSAGHG